MKKFLKNVFYTSLIASYMYGAIAGNIIVLRDYLNSGDKLHQHLTAQKKKSRAIPDAPISVAKSHVVLSSESGQSFHLITTNEIPAKPAPTVVIVNAEIALVHSSLEFLPSKPRDPPLI